MMDLQVFNSASPEESVTTEMGMYTNEDYI